MEFHKLLRDRRQQLKLGVRETARLTEKSFVPFPIKSAIYISRLENLAVEEMRAEKISIDKLWALGVALCVHPLILFAHSRNLPHLVDQIPKFSVREADPAISFSQFLVSRRAELHLTLVQVAKAFCEASPWSISSGYISQLELNDLLVSERISAEKLWALGVVYDVDPLLMYVLSRKVDAHFIRSSARDNLFS